MTETLDDQRTRIRIAALYCFTGLVITLFLATSLYLGLARIAKSVDDMRESVEGISDSVDKLEERVEKLETLMMRRADSFEALINHERCELLSKSG